MVPEAWTLPPTNCAMQCQGHFSLWRSYNHRFHKYCSIHLVIAFRLLEIPLPQVNPPRYSFHNGEITSSCDRQWDGIYEDGVCFCSPPSLITTQFPPSSLRLLLKSQYRDNLTAHSFAGNSEPSFVFPTVIATHQSASSTSSSNAPSSGRAPPPVAGKPSHLASKRGIEDLDFFIGDEAVANSKCVSLPPRLPSDHFS